jgi:hypothetical protein
LAASLPVYNDTAALAFDRGLTDSRAKGAISCFHQALLECYDGFPLFYLAERYEPAGPIDEFLVYQAISRTFAEWDGTEKTIPPIPEPLGTFLNRQEAVSFVNSISDVRTRIGLRFFISSISSIHVPGAASIDLLFLCRLLEAILKRHDVLDNILSGGVAAHNARLLKGVDFW